MEKTCFFIYFYNTDVITLPACTMASLLFVLIILPQKLLFKVTSGLMTEKMKGKKTNKQCFCSVVFCLCSWNFSGLQGSGNSTNSRWQSSGLDAYSKLICCPTSAGITDASTRYQLILHVLWLICAHLHGKKNNVNLKFIKKYLKVRRLEWADKTEAGILQRLAYIKKGVCLSSGIGALPYTICRWQRRTATAHKECAHFSYICDSWPLPQGW